MTCSIDQKPLIIEITDEKDLGIVISKDLKWKILEIQ